MTNFPIHHFWLRLPFATCLAVVGLCWTTSVVAAEKSDKLAANEVFDDEMIADNLVAVVHRARKLEPFDRYEFLLDWVLPSASHDTFRVIARFTSADVAESASQSGFTGSGLICPAIDLVDVAKQTGRFQKLRQRVAESTGALNTGLERSAVAMLFLIDLASGDETAMRASAERLIVLVESSPEFDEHDEWPFVVAAWAAMRKPAAIGLVADLLTELQNRRPVLSASGDDTARTAQLASMHAHALRVARDEAPATATQTPPFRNWLSVDIETARTHAEGWPGIASNHNQRTLQITSSHKQSLLFYRLPLRGNFDFSCELSSQAGGDVCLMYGGVHATPLGDPLQNRTGSIRTDQVRSFDPPMTPPGEWIWCRIRVRDDDCTISCNGRVLLHRTLSHDHDPWLAIRTTSSHRQPMVRDLRIDGVPDVPDEVSLCADVKLNGWWPYFDDEIGPDGSWQHRADRHGSGLLALSQPIHERSYKESHLSYYRPLVEGDSIEYDFFHDESAVNIHPALDRVAFLLRPDGVTIHPITDGKYDQTRADPATELVDESARIRLSNLPLKKNDWNHCRLSLSRDGVEFFLNGELVYSRRSRTSNQPCFGFFRYAGDAQAQIRNVVWRGSSSQQFQDREHEIVSLAPHPLDGQIDELEKFEHDFTTGGLPSESFTLPAGKTVSIDILNTGIRHRQISGGSWTDSSIAPVYDLYGDFDVTVSFADLQVSEPEYGGCGVVLRTNDGDVVLLSRRRQKGNLHRVYLTWRVPAGDGEFRFNKDLIITEAPSGRFRIARRGDIYYFLIAENDSPVYRQVAEQKVDGGAQQRVRVELRMIASQGSSTSAIWKNIRFLAEQVKQFHFQVTDDSISDDQWAALAAADGLKKLILDRTDVTDDDLLRLKANPELSLLYLKDTRITSAGVRNFSNLKRLEHLHLTVTPTDDAAATTLAGFPNLQTLGLSYTRVGDATVSKLSRLEKLSVLGLSGTNVTDASIEHLCRMPVLKTVNLRGTRISEDGFGRLRKALPNCEIRHD